MNSIQVFMCMSVHDDGTIPLTAQKWADTETLEGKFLLVMPLSILRTALASNADIRHKVLIPIPEGPWQFKLAQSSMADFGRLLGGDVVRVSPAVVEHITFPVSRADPSPAIAALASRLSVKMKVQDDTGPILDRVRDTVVSLQPRPFLDPEEAMPISRSIQEADNRHAVRAEAAAASRGMGFTGDACMTCGACAMVRTGTCVTCQECGATGGCG